jgi:hypothetical protein
MVELGILAVFGIVMALVVLPFAVTWANGVHLQFPGGSSAGQPSDSPIVSPAGGPGGVTGMITAGPVCPVEQSPPDPKCAPRPVAGAVVVATDAIGDEVGRTTSLADGSYWLVVGRAGTVVITALPVTGLVRAPAPVSVMFLDQHEWERVNLEYDTGIR